MLCSVAYSRMTLATCLHRHRMQPKTSYDSKKANKQQQGKEKTIRKTETNISSDWALEFSDKSRSTRGPNKPKLRAILGSPTISPFSGVETGLGGRDNGPLPDDHLRVRICEYILYLFSLVMFRRHNRCQFCKNRASRLLRGTR